MLVTTDALQQVFKNAFDNKELQVTDTTTRDDIEEWDSINHLNLVIELEDTFSVKFSVKEIEDMDSVAGILTILNNKS